MKNEEKVTKIDLPNWHKISPKTMDFYFAETEKRLVNSIENFKNTKQVAYRILGIVLPLVSVAIGFTFSKDQPLNIPIAMFVSIEAVGLLFIILAMYSQSIMPNGSKPVQMIKDEMVIDGHSDEQQYLAVLLNYCENLQDRIDHNERINLRLVRRVNVALTLCGVVGPLLFAVTSFAWAFYR